MDRGIADQAGLTKPKAPTAGLSKCETNQRRLCSKRKSANCKISTKRKTNKSMHLPKNQTSKRKGLQSNCSQIFVTTTEGMINRPLESQPSISVSESHSSIAITLQSQDQNDILHQQKQNHEVSSIVSQESPAGMTSQINQETETHCNADVSDNTSIIYDDLINAVKNVKDINGIESVASIIKENKQQLKCSEVASIILYGINGDQLILSAVDRIVRDFGVWYVHAFGDKIAGLFHTIFKKASVEDRRRMFKLRNGWTGLFTESCLLQLDLKVYNFDSAWPLYKFFPKLNSHSEGNSKSSKPTHFIDLIDTSVKANGTVDSNTSDGDDEGQDDELLPNTIISHKLTTMTQPDLTQQLVVNSSPTKRQKVDTTKAVLLDGSANKSHTDNESFESFAREHLRGNSTVVRTPNAVMTENFPPKLIDTTKAVLLNDISNDSANKIDSTIDEVHANAPNKEEVVPLYESSKSIDEYDLEDVATPKERKPKEVKNWKLICQYANPEVAKFTLEQEKIWSIFNRNDTAAGMKWYYRCNKNKLRDKQCAAQVCHLFQNDSDIVLEYRTNGAHDHDDRAQEIEAKQRLVAEVERLLKLHQKPNEIMHALSEINGLVLPTKKQLTNIIAALRKKKFGPPTISMQELSKWLEEHSAIPEDEHESFVLCFEVNVESVEPYFRFMITTKYLLKLAQHRPVTHADTTYKCIWQGFPVLMVGTTDLAKAYHPYALSVCSNERTADYHFIFEGIKEGLRRVFGYENLQTALVSDAAFAIINTFIEVHGVDVIIVMCWYHAKTAMEDHLTIVKKPNRKSILEDIEFLHIASTPQIFRDAVKLFLNKWEKEEAEYCKYFQSEWVEQHPNWYLGAAEYIPCHNNALESSNRYLKESNTIRMRHPLSHFLRVACETTHKWSKRYIIGTKSFALEQIIDTASWTVGYQWEKSNVEAKIIRQDDETLTVVVDASVVATRKRNNKDGVLIQSSVTQSEIVAIIAKERNNSQKRQKINPQGDNVKPQPTTESNAAVSASNAAASALNAAASKSNAAASKSNAVACGSNAVASGSNAVASAPAPAEFEKYKLSFLKWTVTISKKPNNLNDGKCNCPAFHEEYMCKHIIGLSIRMKYVTAPPEARTVPCGEKRKRGRPSKTKRALLYQ